MKKIRIIAIDGPAGSGKSTIGEKLASELGYLYFDTGVMYRAVTLAVLEARIDVDDESTVTDLAQCIQIDVLPPSQTDGRAYDVMLNGSDVTWAIRSGDVEGKVSKVSAYRGVRSAMTIGQRRIGDRGAVVMVGRDIGTVVFPNADVKIFLDASVEERARRRYEENLARGKDSNYEEILSAMQKRDHIDSNREVAPLKPAADAILVNTDGLSIEDVLTKVRTLIDNE